MATVELSGTRLLEADRRFVLHGISWESYERLLEDLADNSCVRLTYDRGTLEFMSPSPAHERLKERLSRLIQALTEELDVEIGSLGSTTWRRREVERGIEADSCFYITNAPLVREKLEFDLAIDPPPDLAIEVEASSSSIDKMAIYAAMGVPEVWTHDLEKLRILSLQANGEYAEQETSAYFSKEAVDGISRFLETPMLLGETAWIKRFRKWVRENLVK